MQRLFAFTDIFGDGPGQVPLGSAVNSATLKLRHVNINNNRDVYFYRMTVPWDESVMWDSLGGGIIPGVNAEPESVITANMLYNKPATVSIDVTDTVNKWANGQPNYGWGIVSDSANAIHLALSQNTSGCHPHSPILEIDHAVPEPATLTLLLLGGLQLLYRPKS